MNECYDYILRSELVRSSKQGRVKNIRYTSFYTFLLHVLLLKVDQDSSVAIATRYRLNDSGIESR